jgi:putative hydrolase of HD superfamily
MEEKDTLWQALGTVLTLQRWNFLPRIETWVEAENSIFVAHVGYAIGKTHGLNDEELLLFIQRTLLRSLVKHFTTDISVPIKDMIKDEQASDQYNDVVDDKTSNVWEIFLKQNINKTANLFPRIITDKVINCLGEYNNPVCPSKEGFSKVDDLLVYAHNRVALDECEVNQNIFKEEYGTIFEDINKRIQKVMYFDDYDKIYKELVKNEYFKNIKRLKYLRRWNKINRVIHTSVLAHTYLVSVLVIIICWLEEKKINEIEVKWRDEGSSLKRLSHIALLRALFHDLPESFTGDIVTPVKLNIKAINKNALNNIENKLKESFINLSKAGLKNDLLTYGLLDPLNDTIPNTVDSLVKDCDRLSNVLECVYENNVGNINDEMNESLKSNALILQRSEWPSLRQFAMSLISKPHIEEI